MFIFKKSATNSLNDAYIRDSFSVLEILQAAPLILCHFDICDFRVYIYVYSYTSVYILPLYNIFLLDAMEWSCSPTLTCRFVSVYFLCPFFMFYYNSTISIVSSLNYNAELTSKRVQVELVFRLRSNVIFYVILVLLLCLSSSYITELSVLL